MWISWVAYWFWASRNAKPTERREPLGSRLLHVVPLVLAVALLWGERGPIAILNRRLFP
jgi:hypothetical protein